DQDVQRPGGCDLVGRHRVRDRARHRGHRPEVDDRTTSFYDRLYISQPPKVAFDEFDVVRDLGEIRGASGREIVEHADVSTLHEEPSHHVGANEARTARYENTHAYLRPLGAARQPRCLSPLLPL